ncbi:hypothetical protein BIW11_04714, partial [Tropilaelaps mercedesae]
NSNDSASLNHSNGSDKQGNCHNDATIDKHKKHNATRHGGCDTSAGEALRLAGPAKPTTLTDTARGTSVSGPLQARLASASFVKPSADPQLAFPASSAAVNSKPPHLPCRWKECRFSARKDFELADHIADAHVAAQGDKGPFVCLWEACKSLETSSLPSVLAGLGRVVPSSLTKRSLGCGRLVSQVFNVPSTLKHWLEQHVVKHSRSKPLKCIVDGCPQRFSTKALLEAHVNSHFEKNPKLKNEASLKSQNQLLKLAKRKRLLRQHSKMQGKLFEHCPLATSIAAAAAARVTAGRKYDFFDACIMHQIKEGLLQFAELEKASSSTIAHPRSHYPAQSYAFLAPASSVSSDPSVAPLTASAVGDPQQPPGSGRKRAVEERSHSRTSSLGVDILAQTRLEATTPTEISRWRFPEVRPSHQPVTHIVSTPTST